MRMFVVSVSALFLLVGANAPVLAAAAPALAKNPVHVQAHALVEKTHGWKRRYYRPRVYGYSRRPHHYRRWYRPRVYGYRYRPYRHRHWKWRRRGW